jgi:hypothetical protein
MTTPNPPRRRALPTLSPCACGRKPIFFTYTAYADEWAVRCSVSCWRGPFKPGQLRAALAWNRVMRAVAEKKGGGR